MRIALPVNPAEKGDVYNINQAYVEYLSLAKLSPILVNPYNDPKEIAKICDGLLLPGGKDIDPLFYGQSNWSSFWCDPEKDDFERKLFWAFADAGKRVFGICRGHQLVAREYLHHMPPEKTDKLYYLQHIDDHSQTNSLWRRVASHFVDVHARLIYGPEAKGNYLQVNSMHHQALAYAKGPAAVEKKAKITDHMYVTAWTDRGLDLDKNEEGVVIEGFILVGWQQAPIMCVQWHPEELKDKALIGNFFRGISAPVSAPAKKTAKSVAAKKE